MSNEAEIGEIAHLFRQALDVVWAEIRQLSRHAAEEWAKISQ